MQVARLFQRLESLSHILLWGNEATGDVERVELPRLRLSFAVSRGGGGAPRLWCEQQAGLYVVEEEAAADEKLARLLVGLEHAIVLTNAADELFVLASAAVKPSRSRPVAPFVCEVSLVRNDPDWLQRLGDIRYYLYPVHVSRSPPPTTPLAVTTHLGSLAA